MIMWQDGPDETTPQFTCVICRRHHRDRRHFAWGDHVRDLPPICIHCELGPEHVRDSRRRRCATITQGAMLDMRMANQIGSLIDTLEFEARGRIGERQ